MSDVVHKLLTSSDSCHVTSTDRVDIGGDIWSALATSVTDRLWFLFLYFARIRLRNGAGPKWQQCCLEQPGWSQDAATTAALQACGFHEQFPSTVV